MAAEALIVEDAYQRGYADAIADMRKKKEQRRQREQAKKARRWYFIKQKAYGLAMLAVTMLAAGGAAVIRGGMDVQPFAAVIPRLYEMPEK